MKDLTTSSIDRQNVLNNTEAIGHIQKHIGITGLLYEGVYYFTNKMVADFYQVSTRTRKQTSLRQIKSMIINHLKELKAGLLINFGSKSLQFKRVQNKKFNQKNQGNPEIK